MFLTWVQILDNSEVVSKVSAIVYVKKQNHEGL